ncbi:hypothetical protein DGWBC_1735 [Dehalogenimonas sp. WBC-2]|nr:hypothetical protein DGWBC_1735 [Dehalogenimonas sp. WBC-2]
MSSIPLSSPEAVKKTWGPTVGGILNIINGTLELLGGLTIIGVAEILPMFNSTWLGDIWGFPLIIAGIVAIIGGVSSFRRRAWKLALTGSVCSLFMLHWTLTGIFAFIFIASAKKEFVHG